MGSINNYIEYICIKNFSLSGFRGPSSTIDFEKGQKYNIKYIGGDHYHVKEFDKHIGGCIKYFKKTSLVRDNTLDKLLKESLFRKLLNVFRYG